MARATGARVISAKGLDQTLVSITPDGRIEPMQIGQGIDIVTQPKSLITGDEKEKGTVRNRLCVPKQTNLG